MSDSSIKKLYRFLSPKFQSVFLDYQVDAKPRYGHGKPPHAGLHSIIDKHRNSYAAFLKQVLSYQDHFLTIKMDSDASNPSLPNWDNSFLPGLDIVALYSMLAENKPAKYMEIGSGNSTKVAHKAKVEHQLATEIISIDPMPRAEIDSLADRVVREPFESIDLSIIDELGENDILFIDNSHRILPNSDSMVFYLEMLPRLKKGVIVQIHDVYLPYDYPQFMCDRFYSEQYGLAMFLLANAEKYQPILPNYFISEDKELSHILQPLWSQSQMAGVEKHGGSFWLKIC